MRKKQIDDGRERKPEADDGGCCPHCGRLLVESSGARRRSQVDRDYERYADLMERVMEEGD